MDRRLKERLIGAAVLVMLAVIFIPMILNDSSETEVRINGTNIPELPQDNFNSRIVPLQESDLTPLVEEQKRQLNLETEQLPETEDVSEISNAAQTIEAEIEEKSSLAEQKIETANTNQVGATAWVVQLGSFNSEENARALNEKLRKSGYPAFVEPLKRESGMNYRVRVGPELLRSDAENLKTKLKTKENLEGIVIRYP